MITVSATAVGIPFGMEMPKLSDTLPNGITWVIIVIAIGALISIVAAKGYDTVSKAANYMAPIIVLGFLFFPPINLPHPASTFRPTPSQVRIVVAQLPKHFREFLYADF